MGESSLHSSKRLVFIIPVVGTLCALSTSKSSSSSNRRSNRDVNAGMVSSNARQPDIFFMNLCCVAIATDWSVVAKTRKNRQGDSYDLFEACTNQIKTRLFSARQEFCCSIEPRECPRSCKTHGVVVAPRGMKRIESDARLLHSQCLVDDVLFDQMNWIDTSSRGILNQESKTTEQ